MSEVTHRLTQKLEAFEREAVGGRPQRSPANQSLEARDRVDCPCFVCLYFTRLLGALDGGTDPQTEGHEGCFPFLLAQKLGYKSTAFWAWRAVEHPPAKLT